MNLGDSRLTTSNENRLAVAQQIRLARPKTIILPYWEGRHPDHYTAATLGYEACYAAGLKKLDLDGEPHRPHKILYSTIYWDVDPSFVVDISSHFDRKMEAVDCFVSQFEGDMGEIMKLFPAWGPPDRPYPHPVQVLWTPGWRGVRRNPLWLKKLWSSTTSSTCPRRRFERCDPVHWTPRSE